MVFVEDDETSHTTGNVLEDDLDEQVYQQEIAKHPDPNHFVSR